MSFILSSVKGILFVILVYPKEDILDFSETWNVL